MSNIGFSSDPRLGILNVAKLCNITLINEKTTGAEVIARCPFCGDSEDHRHGHLYLNLEKDSYRCVKCGEKGFATGMYAKLHGIDNKAAYMQLMGMETTTEMVNMKRKAEQARVPQHEIVNIKVRDKAYRSLLSMLKLDDEHYENLRRRGIPKEYIEHKMYKSVPQNVLFRKKVCRNLINQGFCLKGIPGFFIDNKGDWDFYYKKGILVPVLNLNRQVQGMQVRLDGEEHRKYRWFSSKGFNEGTGTDGWIHVAWNRKHTYKKVAITEGPLKGDVSAYICDTTFLCTPGAGIYDGLEGILKLLKPEQLVIAYDMDYKINEQVAAHLENLKKYLKDNKWKFILADWDISEGKGIDDYLYNLAKQRTRERKERIQASA